MKITFISLVISCSLLQSGAIVSQITIVDIDRVTELYTNRNYSALSDILRQSGFKLQKKDPDYILESVDYFGHFRWICEYTQPQLNERTGSYDMPSTDLHEFHSTRYPSTDFDSEVYDLSFRFHNSHPDVLGRFVKSFLAQRMPEYNETKDGKSIKYNAVARPLENNEIRALELKTTVIDYQHYHGDKIPVYIIYINIRFSSKINKLSTFGKEIRLPLTLRQDGLYSLKVNIGGRDIDFILDSGASYLTIDNELFSALVGSGHIRPSDIKEKIKVQLADSSVNEAQLVNIGVINLSGTLLYDVQAIVLPTGAYLFGQSCLSRFARWHIDKGKSQLIIQK